MTSPGVRISSVLGADLFKPLSIVQVIPVASCVKCVHPMSAPDPANNRENILTLLLQRGECDAGELAEARGISVQAMRRHLRGLADDALVEASSTATGPGRPSNRWRLTRKGREHFPDGSGGFAINLLDSMRSSLPPEMLASLLNQQAISKAETYRKQLGDAPLQQRLDKLATLRRDEGYISECIPDQDGGWRLQEVHCTVQRIAEAFPVVCDQELLLIQRTFPDCRVERVHWRLEGGHACGFQITPSQSA